MLLPPEKKDDGEEGVAVRRPSLGLAAPSSPPRRSDSGPGTAESSRQQGYGHGHARTGSTGRTRPLEVQEEGEAELEAEADEQTPLLPSYAEASLSPRYIPPHSHSQSQTQPPSSTPPTPNPNPNPPPGLPLPNSTSTYPRSSSKNKPPLSPLLRFTQAMCFALGLVVLSGLIGGLVKVGWRWVKRGEFWSDWEDTAGGSGRDGIGRWDKNWAINAPLDPLEFSPHLCDLFSPLSLIRLSSPSSSSSSSSFSSSSASQISSTNGSPAYRYTFTNYSLPYNFTASDSNVVEKGKNPLLFIHNRLNSLDTPLDKRIITQLKITTWEEGREIVMKELKGDLFASTLDPGAETNEIEIEGMSNGGEWEIPGFESYWEDGGRRVGEVGVLVIARSAGSGPSPSLGSSLRGGEEVDDDSEGGGGGGEVMEMFGKNRRRVIGQRGGGGSGSGVGREGIHVCQAGNIKDGINGILMINSGQQSPIPKDDTTDPTTNNPLSLSFHIYIFLPNPLSPPTPSPDAFEILNTPHPSPATISSAIEMGGLKKLDLDLRVRGEGMEVTFVSDFGGDEVREGGGGGGLGVVDVRVGGEGINVKGLSASEVNLITTNAPIQIGRLRSLTSSTLSTLNSPILCADCCSPNPARRPTHFDLTTTNANISGLYCASQEIIAYTTNANIRGRFEAPIVRKRAVGGEVEEDGGTGRWGGGGWQKSVERLVLALRTCMSGSGRHDTPDGDGRGGEGSRADEEWMREVLLEFDLPQEGQEEVQSAALAGPKLRKRGTGKLIQDQLREYQQMEALADSAQIPNDPYLNYRPAFAYSLPAQLLIQGITLTLLAVLLIHILFTTQYHFPLSKWNYSLQLSGILLVLGSIMGSIVVVLNTQSHSSKRWPYMLDYVSVHTPPPGWSTVQRGFWYLLQSFCNCSVHLTHIQFLTLLFPSATEVKLIFFLLGPLALAASGLVFTSMASDRTSIDLGDAIRNVFDSTLLLIFSLSLIIWGFMVNRKRAWRLDGGTGVFGAGSVILAIISTAMNFVEVREDTINWLQNLTWAIVLWQSWLGFWWWVGSGMGVGEVEDIMVKEEKRRLRAQRRKEKRLQVQEASRNGISTAVPPTSNGDANIRRTRREPRVVLGDVTSGGEEIEMAEMPERSRRTEGTGRPTVTSSSTSSDGSPLPLESVSGIFSYPINLILRFVRTLRSGHEEATKEKFMHRADLRRRVFARETGGSLAASGIGDEVGWGLGSYGIREAQDGQRRLSEAGRIARQSRLLPNGELRDAGTDDEDDGDGDEGEGGARTTREADGRRDSDLDVEAGDAIEPVVRPRSSRPASARTHRTSNTPRISISRPTTPAHGDDGREGEVDPLSRADSAARTNAGGGRREDGQEEGSGLGGWVRKWRLKDRSTFD